MSYMHCIGVCLAALVLGTIASHGQITGSKTLGEEVRPLEQSKHGDDIAIGEIPKTQAKPQKTTAIVKGVNLETRKIRVVPVKKGGTFRVAALDGKGRVWSNVDEMEIGFLVPAGVEKIRASAKAAKRLRKRGLRLEDIPA